MESEACDRGASGGSREPGHDGTLSEVERLRRENRRLEARVAIEERRREHLIDRYEALLPDGNEDGDRFGWDGRGRNEANEDGGRERSGEGGTEPGPSGVASAAGYAVWTAFTRGRRYLRSVRTRW